MPLRRKSSILNGMATEKGGVPLTGFLHTMTEEQRIKLYQLWAMFSLFIRLPYEQVKKRKIGELAREFYGLVRNGQAHDEMPITEAMIESNPVVDTLFKQTSTDDPDTLLLRFLRARKWDLVDTFIMLVECSEWRLEYGVHELTAKGEAAIHPGLMGAGKGFVWSQDKRGRICCYARAKLHNKNTQSLTESANFLVYWLEMGRQLRQYDEQCVTVIMDMRDAGLSSFDMPFVQFMLKCLQNYYPEILGEALILDAPWIFWGFWKMISPLMDPVVAAKIKFLKGSQLKEYIDEEQIPQELNGTSAFSYVRVYESSNPPSDYTLRTVDEKQQRALRVLEIELIQLNAKALAGEQVQEERDQIKAQLQKRYFDLLQAVYPPTFYHRIGVLDRNGNVDWSQYLEQHQPSRPALKRSLSVPPPSMRTSELEAIFEPMTAVSTGGDSVGI